MTIEVHQPELEALIQQRMATGRFHDVEDVLLDALKNTGSDLPVPRPGKNLVEVFARAREILDGEELDLTRDPSPGRTVDLS